MATMLPASQPAPAMLPALQPALPVSPAPCTMEKMCGLLTSLMEKLEKPTSNCLEQSKRKLELEIEELKAEKLKLQKTNAGYKGSLKKNEIKKEVEVKVW